MERQLAHRRVGLFVTGESELTGLADRVECVVMSGCEGGGVVANEGTLVLLRRLLRRTDRDIWVLGGLGPEAAADAVAAGARGVFLTDVLWATPEAKASVALLQLLERFDAENTECLGRYFDFRVRVFREKGTMPPRRFDEQERARMGEARERAAAACWQLLLRMVPDADFNPGTTLLPLGQTGALARALSDRLGHAAGILEHYAEVIEAKATSKKGIEAGEPAPEPGRGRRTVADGPDRSSPGRPWTACRRADHPWNKSRESHV